MIPSANEMERAREMQRAALPLEAPNVPGYQLAVRAKPADTIGGDFHLFLTPSDREPSDRIALVLGDVSGKGIAAALAATSIGHLFPWLGPLRHPQRALTNLNRDLCQHLPECTFASMVMAEIRIDTGRVRLWSAGHPPALLWRARTGEVFEAEAADVPLGCFTTWFGKVQEWSLEEDDILVLYTDGLIEARNDQGEPFGMERLAALLPHVVATTRRVDEVADALIAGVCAWGPLTDDTTVLVCRRVAAVAGTPPPTQRMHRRNSSYRRDDKTRQQTRSMGRKKAAILLSGGRLFAASPTPVYLIKEAVSPWAETTPT